jgi:pimeloyl-ACP methyl ester carboxylesterase
MSSIVMMNEPLQRITLPSGATVAWREAGEGPPHEPYTKRAMAQVLVDFMVARGHARFQVLAHDRGARVAHRLGLDHPQAVERLMLLDIAPTLDMYAGTNATFARQYFHWFFLIQPARYPAVTTFPRKLPTNCSPRCWPSSNPRRHHVQASHRRDCR